MGQERTQPRLTESRPWWPTTGLWSNQASSANYNAAVQVQQSVSVSAAQLTITSAAQSGGNKKHVFAGTGGAAGSTITVSVCATNNFPSCAVESTATATVLANGTWTTAQSSANITAGNTYYARAVQGTPAKTSAVFQFTA